MTPELDPTDGMISRSELAKELLLFRMRQLSETFFSKEWVEDLESDVWDMAFNGQKLFDQIDVTPEMSKFFRDLANLADGWWINNGEVQPDDSLPLDGLVFVSMARWKEIYAEAEEP